MLHSEKVQEPTMLAMVFGLITNVVFFPIWLPLFWMKKLREYAIWTLHSVILWAKYVTQPPRTFAGWVFSALYVRNSKQGYRETDNNGDVSRSSSRLRANENVGSEAPTSSVLPAAAGSASGLLLKRIIIDSTKTHVPSRGDQFVAHASSAIEDDDGETIDKEKSIKRADDWESKHSSSRSDIVGMMTPRKSHLQLGAHLADKGLTINQTSSPAVVSSAAKFATAENASLADARQQISPQQQRDDQTRQIRDHSRNTSRGVLVRKQLVGNHLSSRPQSPASISVTGVKPVESSNKSSNGVTLSKKDSNSLVGGRNNGGGGGGGDGVRAEHRRTRNGAPRHSKSMDARVTGLNRKIKSRSSAIDNGGVPDIHSTLPGACMQRRRHSLMGTESTLGHDNTNGYSNNNNKNSNNNNYNNNKNNNNENNNMNNNNINKDKGHQGDSNSTNRRESRRSNSRNHHSMANESETVAAAGSSSALFILTLSAARTHVMLVKLYRVFVVGMVLLGACVLKYGLPAGVVLGFPVRSLFDMVFVPVFLMLVSFRSDFPFNLLVLLVIAFLFGCLAGTLVTLSSSTPLSVPVSFPTLVLQQHTSVSTTPHSSVDHNAYRGAVEWSVDSTLPDETFLVNH